VRASIWSRVFMLGARVAGGVSRPWAEVLAADKARSIAVNFINLRVISFQDLRE
jgi:hypothetical protein